MSYFLELFVNMLGESKNKEIITLKSISYIFFFILIVLLYYYNIVQV